VLRWEAELSAGKNELDVVAAAEEILRRAA
jgi:hypothetical protein